jgi:hypothetical protein
MPRTEKIIPVDFVVTPDTDLDTFFLALFSVYQGTAGDEDAAYVRNHTVRVDLTDQGKPVQL